MNLDGIAGPCDVPPVLEVGTLVEMAGMKGVVTDVEADCWHDFPVEIRFESGLVVTFTSDGKQFKQQKHSLLKVIGKKPVKVKKWLWAVQCVTGESPWKLTDTYMNELECIIRHRLDKRVKIEESEREFEQ